MELLVLTQRNSALRNEALAYLFSELVTCLDAVCFSLLVEETAINYGYTNEKAKTWGEI